MLLKEGRNTTLTCRRRRTRRQRRKHILKLKGCLTVLTTGMQVTDNGAACFYDLSAVAAVAAAVVVAGGMTIHD